jgi:hypothetical protein
MRIKLSYLSWPYTDTDPIGLALKSATNSVITLIQSILQVTRSGIVITISRCYDVDVPIGDRNVLLPYDLAICATAVAGTGYFANAVACQLSPYRPYRSIAGRISFNTAQMTSSSTTAFGFQTLSRVAFH